MAETAIPLGRRSNVDEKRPDVRRNYCIFSRLLTIAGGSLMSKFPLDLDPSRLLQLSEEVSRIAASLSQISLGVVQPPIRPKESQQGNEPCSKDAVTWLIRARRERARYLNSDLFCDPAWDILLDLLRAELAMQRVSVSSLCIASGVPATTALRYLKTMAQQGMIIRHADPRDGRRVFVELAPEVSSALRQYFVNVIQTQTARDQSSRAAA